MKNNTIKYLLIILGITSLTSCEDYLTEVNPNEITVDTYWRTLGDCNTGLTSVYNQFKDKAIFSAAEEMKRSDMTYPGYGRPKDDIYYNHTFNASSTAPGSKWEALYMGIFRANQVLTGLAALEQESIEEGNEEFYTQIKAQAHFFRGLFYFYLHNSFNNGEVVIYDFVPKEEEEYFRPLSPSDSVVAFYRKDLEYAAENLPLIWEAASSKGRVTSGTANSVLGKSYLYQADYKTAELYFKKVIDSGVYTLADVTENMTTNGEFNSESILEVSYSLNYKVDEGTGSQGTATALSCTFSPMGGYRSVIPSAWLAMTYMKDSIDTSDERNVNGIDEETGLSTYRHYSLRTSYSIGLVDELDLDYYGKIAAECGKFKNFECSYWRKNTNWDVTDDERTLLKRSGINYRVIRYADILLMYAECLIKGGTDGSQLPLAMNLINQVRNRAALLLIGEKAMDTMYPDNNHNEVVYDAKSLMEHLMYIERPLELSCEGYAIRQLDLRRWGITKERFEYLSTLEFHADIYKTTHSETGKTLNKGKSWLKEGFHESKTAWNIVEFDVAAQNYIPSEHDYWPIPTGESIANPFIN